MTNESQNYFDSLQDEEFEEVYARIMDLVVKSNLSVEQINHLFGYIYHTAQFDPEDDIRKRHDRDA